MSGEQMALPGRFWAKVDKDGPSECWVWTAATSAGYGKFALDGRLHNAHRLAYESLVGPIPDGLVIDHLCRNRACVNPGHLEPVTDQVNILRGIGPAALHAVKTHCPQGHAYDDQNTYHYRGLRYCQTCKRQHAQRAKERQSQVIRNDPNDPRHGSVLGYSTYRCRCEDCRTAWREYHRARRVRAG